MSDIYIPGVKSRFNTEKLIEDLMKIERIPKERSEKNIEGLETQKTWWQGVGSRLSSLRDSSRFLYSFQNPFNERLVRSSDEGSIIGSATREAVEQERTFTVKQTAQADRFLSSPLEENFKADPGTYTFTIGEERISFNFRGGSLKEFTDTLNRHGRDKIQGSLITVKKGTKSLLIESKITGGENRLGFAGEAESLGQKTGMVERANDSRRDIGSGAVTVNAGERLSIPVNPGIPSSPALVIKFEISTEVRREENLPVPQPPPGPSIPSGGSVSYGGIVIENDSSSAPIPAWTPPPVPKRVDDMGVLSLTFSDGSSALLPAISDSPVYADFQYPLTVMAGDKTIVSFDLDNKNTHRDVSIRNIAVFDPAAVGGFKPLNAVSTAQDAILSMEGIEIRRPGNIIEDLVPGVTVTAVGSSDRPVKLKVEPDREAVKNAIITLVGNYNQVMAEINVLTRNDERVVEELSYLPKEEREELRKRLGVLMGDSTLSQIRSSMQRIAGAPYPTLEDSDISLLAQIGIGTDVRRGGGAGYDPSRLRGYLEIDEKVLDAALQTDLPAIQKLFGSDTNGDLIADTGVAYGLETLAKPYVETGGIIALKTGTADNRIDQEKRKIDTLDRQLSAKEADLKRQYGQMEGAYNRMEQMGASLDRFNQQNSNTNGR
jgi:flagellar hook-associated protein 2